ncbi:hypothetical protein PHYPSEUDO_001409 [Phytophthora pseudosyringae]|uniref:Ion transport domain-containing protein n=1 Tax=Phytophthora pseudosyringae TaxID=221518 RepID=A0A8T1WGI4_9STRA|nr:hypothetical protein PHYPSEUDO_001409 [Phytophthora pseudosyringae]
MSDGSIKTSSGLDDRPAVAQAKLLPGRLETSAQLGYDDIEQLPSSIPDAVGKKSARSSIRSGLSRYHSFTTRSPSREAYTAPPDIPVVPTSMGQAVEESDRELTQGRTDSEHQTKTTGQSPRLVKRSSLNRTNSGGGSFKVPRVHPVLSNGGVENSGGRQGSHDRAISDASERLSSFAVQDMATLNRKLSLHRVHVASRSDSAVVASTGNAAGSSQQPLDPPAHRMIYFRTKKELSELFVLPPVSLWGRRFNRVVFVLIMMGIADLAIETCDGPNMGSSDPGYPYLPSEEDHEIYDGLFAGLFTLEFIGRIIQTRNVRASLHDPFMWLDLVGISPWYIMQLLEVMQLEADVEHYVNQLRLVRTVRLALILRHYEQTKIIYLAIKASLRPLSITLFFLFTLVMVLATAIFYAEPCYNVETCTFTDIFNSAYFVMLTVATVGYGRQVPNLKNPGSLMLTMIAMILGQIYFSMPVAIIGKNFHLTNENFQMDKKKKARYLDASLSPFDCQRLHSHAKRLCDIQYHLLNAWSVVHNHLYGIARTNTRTTQSMTMTMETLETEADRHSKIKEGISRLLEVHAEAVILLEVFIPHRRRPLDMNQDPQSQGVLSNMYAKAKRAMAMAKVKSGHHSAVVDPRTAYQTLRGRIWLLLEVPDSSRLATIVNQAMVAFALVSIMLFFTESLQELAASGVETNVCKTVVKSYCGATGFAELDPACFMRLDNGTSDFSERLHFSCSSETESPECYGNGLNFGSLNTSALPCTDAFLDKGAEFVCYRQQCRASLNMIFDMGPYWIYFEWWFGIVFTLELALRFYISQNRKAFWRNVYVVFDVVAILPFFVEVIELFFAQIQPDYAIVATAPSLLSVIRVLKIMRILKLTRHFRGTKVLASTAIKVWKPLVIPLFFLFTGCIIAGAMFYEIERGTECFVGESCLWWNKNVLTPELAAGLPIGKRILIQDKVKTTIFDMIHSTWLSYTTLTSVGYGDLVARTSIGKFFDVLVIIVATIYSAMPLSLVGTQFYSLYEKHLEKMVVKQGGSSISWRTKSTISIVSQYKQATKHLFALKAESFALSEEHLMIAHEFESMRRTVLNLQRTLDAATVMPLDTVQRKFSLSKGSKASATSRRSMTAGQRSPGRIDQSIEQKSFAIMDTLLQFSQVVERLQEAPVDFEAFEEGEDDLHANIFPDGYSPRPPTDQFYPERG